MVLYPLALAALNVGLGWALYGPLDSPLGLALVLTGLLVGGTVLPSVARRVASALARRSLCFRDGRPGLRR